jgi:hypothetical protein
MKLIESKETTIHIPIKHGSSKPIDKSLGLRIISIRKILQE